MNASTITKNLRLISCLSIFLNAKTPLSSDCLYVVDFHTYHPPSTAAWNYAEKRIEFITVLNSKICSINLRIAFISNHLLPLFSTGLNSDLYVIKIPIVKNFVYIYVSSEVDGFGLNAHHLRERNSLHLITLRYWFYHFPYV